MKKKTLKIITYLHLKKFSEYIIVFFTQDHFMIQM